MPARNCALIICVMFVLCGIASADVKIETLRVPSDGLQPQIVIDAKGTLHLIYFNGEPAGGDLFYVRREPGKSNFSPLIRINSVPNSAVSIGSIRGAQMAMGRNNRLHVAWNPSHKCGAKGMQYTRLNDAGNAFEDQKSIPTDHVGLDGGGSVAADDSGNVYVVWHAPQTPTGKEAERRVWVDACGVPIDANHPRIDAIDVAQCAAEVTREQ